MSWPAEAEAQPEYPPFLFLKMSGKSPRFLFSLLHSSPSLYSCLILTHMDAWSDWRMRPRSLLMVFMINMAHVVQKIPSKFTLSLMSIERPAKGLLLQWGSRHKACCTVSFCTGRQGAVECVSLCASGAAHGELLSNMSRRGEEGGCCLSSCP